MSKTNTETGTTSNENTTTTPAKGGAPTLTPKPIKQDLFRFVTLRTPQLISEQRKDLGFIFHPDLSKSFFFSDIQENETLDTKRSKVHNKAKEFNTHLTTYLKVKRISKDLYNFSLWLMDNRNSISFDEAIEKMGNTPVLPESDLHAIWDNLYYQALTRKSSYVRQACLQMIIANNIVATFQNHETARYIMPKEALIKILANAKVVIDKAFTIGPENTAKQVQPDLSKVFNAIISESNIQVAKEEKNILKGAVEDLENFEITYQKKYQEAFKAKHAEYEEEIAPIIAEEQNRIEIKQQEEDDIATSQGRTPRIIKSAPKLPVFEFEYPSPFSKEFLRDLNDETNTVLNTLKLTKKDSIQGAISGINNQVAINNQLIIDETPTTNQTVSINGGTFVNNNTNYLNDRLKPSCVLAYLRKGLQFNNKRRIYLKVNVGASNLAIVSQSHTLKNAENTVASSTDSTITSYQGNIITMWVFNEVISYSPLLSLTGTITLSNNTKIDYEVRIVRGKGYACSTIETIGDTTTTPLPKVELYGVGKIGIADFRKVEQEVCCYVPGQVSHIENILAREFKKRETRNLTSIERTSEESSEAEIENLTDTTTTERNEMQSEVASVLNEDQSQAFGVSGSVSGKYNKINFSTNAYADFANASSSSVSNSNAQTYAQEVTERALERIVQKTNKKRTSRVLKEFEENYTHGFDNRAGTQHVSGVYRWIDIIYKNQLVNYGKRLMYEFMVPEPARFYKDAIVKNIENGNVTPDLGYVKPSHPADLNVTLKDLRAYGAAAITPDNYLALAANYNAKIPTAQDKFVNVGTTFTKSQAQGDGDKFTNKSEGKMIRVPEGYAAKKIRTIGITIGGGVVISSGSVLLNQYYQNITDESDSFYTDEVPVSITYNLSWAGNFAVTVRCELTTEAYEKWQIECYNIIMKAYNEQLEQWRDAQLAKSVENTGATEKLRFNPLFNKTLIIREIKRICIEMLTQPFKNPMGQDNYTNGDCDVPTLKQDATFENHAAHVKFFEQAFDWEIMAYVFYPYFWSKPCDWKKLFQNTDGADPIFQAFLQSGMARTVIPVTPGFEDAVAYYIETGDIWNGGDMVVDHEDDLYVSIADEMQIIEGKIEDEWETRVPTNLTIIQKDTIGLDETGLPCCNFVLQNDNGINYTNSIKPSTAELGVINDNNTSSSTETNQ